MPSAVAALTGAQLRAHRILGTGLARTAIGPADLPVWDLGIQDRDGSSRLAIATRLAAPAAIGSVDEPGGTGGRVLLWSLRGAPHLHRRADAARFAAALWPADAADAAARLSGDAGRLHSDGADPLRAYRVVSDAMREVITDAAVKGAASAAVTAAIPARYSGFCRACGSVHVREMLFRVAALPAAIGLVADTKPVVLEPLSHPHPSPSAQRWLDELVTGYYRLYGTGTAAEVATHLGTSAGSMGGSLPADLVTVTVDGARTKAPAAMVDQIVGADVEAAAGLVRLLPPADPLLQPRDRSVLTPDRAAQKDLWPILGSPGAVLAGGGLAGIWRTRASGRTLTVTVTPWRKVAQAERTALETEAELVGTVRGVERTRLVISD
ncbi:MAG TPA: crosslink repair DNA glycosylase YcaQ family protein [Nakamurella sp.]